MLQSPAKLKRLPLNEPTIKCIQLAVAFFYTCFSLFPFSVFHWQVPWITWFCLFFLIIFTLILYFVPLRVVICIMGKLCAFSASTNNNY